MISRSSKIFFAFTLLLSPASFSFAAVSQKAMVATAEPLATQAAVETLKLGGTAADAAIAAQWVLNVVEPLSSGLGGGGFFVYYEAATRKVYTFDGRETAPAAAFPEMFLDKQGKPYEFWPDRNTGGLPVGVPGTLRLLETVHQRFGSGKIPFGKLFEPAIAVAENGFPVSERLSAYIDGEAPRLHLFPGPRRIFLDAQGQALKPGTILKQPELAKTFQLIAEKGPSVFYEGEMAEEIVRAVRGASFHPGLMTLEDLKAYRVKEREPVKGEYRDYEIWSMGPPSSG
ncbi:MAG TPA: gamma-glutamyltransferase, partial [Verrucomicrobiae bacterium]|nr:gamma-glutamyltransferase [Verrucomicrobiae bacterium]